MKTYTVTLSGLERADGEKPYDYAVLAHCAAEAVKLAMDAHMEGRLPQDEDDIWVERCRIGLHAAAYCNDLRAEDA